MSTAGVSFAQTKDVRKKAFDKGLTGLVSMLDDFQDERRVDAFVDLYTGVNGRWAGVPRVSIDDLQRWAVFEGRNSLRLPGFSCILYNSSGWCNKDDHHVSTTHRCIFCGVRGHKFLTSSPFTEHTECPRFVGNGPEVDLRKQFSILLQQFPGCDRAKLESLIFGEVSRISYGTRAAPASAASSSSPSSPPTEPSPTAAAQLSVAPMFAFVEPEFWIGSLQGVIIYDLAHVWSNPHRMYGGSAVDVLRETRARGKQFDESGIRWCNGSHASAARCTFLHILPELGGARTATAVKCPSAHSAATCRQPLQAAAAATQATETRAASSLWDGCTLSDRRVVAVLAQRAERPGPAFSYLPDFIAICCDAAIVTRAQYIYDVTWAPFTRAKRRTRFPPPFFFALFLAALSQRHQSDAPPVLLSWARESDIDERLAAREKPTHCLVFNRNGGWCYNEEQHGATDHFCLFCGSKKHGLLAESFASSYLDSPCKKFVQLRNELLQFLDCYSVLDNGKARVVENDEDSLSDVFVMQLVNNAGAHLQDRIEPNLNLTKLVCDLLGAPQQQPLQQQRQQHDSDDDNQQHPQNSGTVRDDGAAAEVGVGASSSSASSSSACMMSRHGSRDMASATTEKKRSFDWYVQRYTVVARERDTARAVKEVPCSVHRALRWYPYKIDETTEHVFFWCEESCCSVSDDSAKQLHHVFRGFWFHEPADEPVEIMVKTYTWKAQNINAGQFQTLKDAFERERLALERLSLTGPQPGLLVEQLVLDDYRYHARDGTIGNSRCVVATRRRDRTLARELSDPVWNELSPWVTISRRRWLLKKLLFRVREMFRVANDQPQPGGVGAAAAKSVAAASGNNNDGLVFFCHGDIKPLNICLDRDGTGHNVRVDFIDYEFSRFAQLLGDAEGVRRVASASVGGGRLGYAEGWASPSQRSTQRPTPASDMWSLALVIYEILNNRERDPAREPPDLPLFFCDEIDMNKVRCNENVSWVRLKKEGRAAVDSAYLMMQEYGKIFMALEDDTVVKNPACKLAILDTLCPVKCDAGDWKKILRPLFEVAVSETPSDGVAQMQSLQAVCQCVDRLAEQIDGEIRDAQEILKG